MSDTKDGAGEKPAAETVDVPALQAAHEAAKGRIAELETAVETAAAEVKAHASKAFELESVAARLSDEVEHRERVITDLKAELKKYKPEPIGVKLLSPHGYIDDNGRNHYWNVGQVVTDLEEIAHLRSRGAELQVV